MILVVIGLVLLCGLIVIAYHKGALAKIWGYVLPKFQRLRSKKALKTFGIVLVFYVLNDLLQAIAFFFTLSIFVPTIFSNIYIPLLLGSYIFSWLLGYITPGSPGGLGVREVTMISMLSQTPVGLDEITISMALTRAINILGDLVAFLVALGIYKVTQRQTP